MNEPRLRKRKNYFEVEHAQRERDIKLIKRVIEVKCFLPQYWIKNR